MNELESGFSLSELFGMVRRRLPVIALAVAAGAVLAAFVYVTNPASYSATSRVEVQPFDRVPSDDTPGEVHMLTEQALAASDDVMAAVATQLGLDAEPRQVRRNVTVLVTEDSEVMEITYAAGSPGRARDGANAVADAYLEDRRADVDRGTTRAVEAVERQIDEIETLIQVATTSAPDQVAAYQDILTDLNLRRLELLRSDDVPVGRVVRRAATPAGGLSKSALAKAVGILGLATLAGLALALVIDRRDSRGGGRRRVEKMLPQANLRVFPTGRAHRAEVNAAVDRLAVDVAAGGDGAGVRSVLLVGLRAEPPVELAERLASSMTVAGVPTLFVLAGTTDQELVHARVVPSFAGLSSGAPSRPAVGSGEPLDESGPQVAWLRPEGPPESAGLLRRGVVDRLVDRAGREGFETVVFVAGTPTRNAAAVAVGRGVDRTFLVVDDGTAAIGPAIEAILEAGVTVSEVVWT